MLINKTKDGDSLTIALDGRLDTTTAPQLEAEVTSSLDGVKNFAIDMEKLVYVSSAGLRVLLKAQKIMNKQGSMVIKNVSDEIKEIFEVTGFDELLTIEQKMQFEKNDDGTVLKLTLDKKLSAVTADQLEKELEEKLVGVKDFTIDMAKLAYVSSAGLRVLLKAQKQISQNGTMKIINAVPEVMRIFETTGFDQILTIEK